MKEITKWWICMLFNLAGLTICYPIISLYSSLDLRKVYKYFLAAQCVLLSPLIRGIVLLLFTIIKLIYLKQKNTFPLEVLNNGHPPSQDTYLIFDITLLDTMHATWAHQIWFTMEHVLQSYEYRTNKLLDLANAPVNVLPYYSPLGHTWGYSGDLTQPNVKCSIVGQI